MDIDTAISIIEDDLQEIKDNRTKLGASSDNMQIVAEIINSHIEYFTNNQYEEINDRKLWLSIYRDRKQELIDHFKTALNN